VQALHWATQPPNIRAAVSCDSVTGTERQVLAHVYDEWWGTSDLLGQFARSGGAEVRQTGKLPGYIPGKQLILNYL
jgi:hypothetical protein